MKRFLLASGFALLLFAEFALLTDIDHGAAIAFADDVESPCCPGHPEEQFAGQFVDQDCTCKINGQNCVNGDSSNNGAACVGGVGCTGQNGTTGWTSIACSTAPVAGKTCSVVAVPRQAHNWAGDCKKNIFGNPLDPRFGIAWNCTCVQKMGAAAGNVQVNDCTTGSDPC